MELDKTAPELLTGNEALTLGGKPVGFTVLDFWRFQHSNIWDVQEEIAEFIVAKALGQDLPYNKNGWTLWDLNYRGKRIEIKETGYYHSWRTDGKVSQQRTFGITKAYSRYKDNTSEFKRQNDIYVFCLNTGETQDASNPLELDNWRFWVVPTERINRLCGDNKSISLGRVKSITYNQNGFGYAELKTAVDRCCRGLHPFLRDLPAFKSGREYLDWIKEGSWAGNLVSCSLEAYFWDLKHAVDPNGYERPIPEKKMCKALERTLETGEMIILEPDSEFLEGGAKEGQLDGWTYHLEFVDPDDYFQPEVYASLPEDKE